MEIYTIGFAKKTAAAFFDALKQAGIRQVLDIRLNNTSQLAGFTKRDDLKFFLKELCGADYLHEPLLAPTPEILKDYQKKRITWEEYEQRFLKLLAERKVEEHLVRSLFDKPTALLCSEPKPDKCHRRLVAEHLAAKLGNVNVHHL
jgi:uncharacterized protein (DUF488 family)